MSKLYFEMNDKEKQLNHIGESLDYATCMISEGLGGTGDYNLEVEEVNEVQSRTAEHLMSAREGIDILIKSLNDEENYSVEPGEDDETDEGLTVYPINEISDLKAVHNYNIEYFKEAKDEDGRDGTSILLKNKKSNGVEMYRELLFNGNGKIYLSKEF